MDEVADGLFVGPCPRDITDMMALKDQHGVTALVSVQTDDDLASLGLSWQLVWRFLVGRGMSVARRPIVDFRDDTLLEGLDEAVEAVQAARSSGHKTLLHCTAGVNRSPSVAIAWLVAHGGMNLDEAWSQVTERRRSEPNRRVLERWAAARAD